jgi:hypothetical protein
MKKSNLKIALFSLLSGARISLIGQLFGSEIIAILFFPYRKIKGIFQEYPILIKLGGAYSILLFSLIISDLLINHTSSENFVRGWASIAFSFITLFFLVSLLDKNKLNVPIYLLFYSISFFIFRPEMDVIYYEDRTDDFKYYFMGGINPLICLIAYIAYKYRKIYPIFIFFIYALFSLITDARSNGVIFFLSAIILTIKTFNIKMTKLKILAFGVIILLFSYVSYVFYVDSVMSGKLTGNNTQQLKRADNPYNPFDLLMVGRLDVFVAFEAIKDRPLYGYGSWAEDKTGKFVKLQAAMSDTSRLSESDLIRGHSILFTAWLWAGLGGLIGIILMYVLIIKKAFFIFYNTKYEAMIIIVLPFFWEMLWNLLFSPFGHLRQTVPFIFALIIVEYYRIKKNGSLPKTI